MTTPRRLPTLAGLLLLLLLTAAPAAAFPWGDTWPWGDLMMWQLMTRGLTEEQAWWVVYGIATNIDGQTQWDISTGLVYGTVGLYLWVPSENFTVAYTGLGPWRAGQVHVRVVPSQGVIDVHAQLLWWPDDRSDCCGGTE